jgi:hypothetical protein
VIFKTGKKTFISRHIPYTNGDTFLPSPYQCVETPSIDVLWLLSQPFPQLRLNLCISETFDTQLWTALSDKHFPPYTGNISWWISFVVSPFAPEHNRKLFFVSTLLKHSHHFDHWNQPLNMRMRVCDLDSYESGLCCYLVIHIENVLHTLQLFYFQLRPVYWIPLVLKLLLGWR